MEGGSPTEEEIEKSAEALMDVDRAIEEIKEEKGISRSVQAIRDGLDDLVKELLIDLVDPSKGDALPISNLVEK